MNEVVTFFRHRKNDPGETYQRDYGTCRFFVYSRKPISSGLPGNRRNVGRSEQDGVLKDLQGVVNKQGGGIIVKTIDEVDGRTVELTTNGAKSGSVREFVVLSPGRPPRFSGNNTEKVPPASHLIVPIDEDSLDHLHQFVEQLAWLPADLENLILNAIRRPSLDARLDKVESKLFGETAEQTANAGRLERMTLRIRRWMTPAAYRIAALFVLALLLGANALLLRRIDSKIAPRPAASPSKQEKRTTDEPAQKNSGKESAVLPKEPEFVDEARELFQLLREKRTRNPQLQTLYDVHFAELDAAELTDEGIARLFRQYDGSASDPANRPFLWGVVKLQALKLDPQPLDRTFLTKWDEITATKNVFQSIGLPRIQEDADGQGLLAAVACRMGYDSPDAPGLRRTATEAFVFVPNGKCADYSTAHLEHGLQGLVAFMEQVP